MQLINKNRFFWKKKLLYKKSINILINFIDFLCENTFFITKLDRMSKFNKFET